jgi:hypothetical protein
MNDILIALIEKWENTAQNKFRSSERQKDNPANRPTGKQFIENGAICYANCARELRVILASVSPQVSTTQEVNQK